MAPRGTEMSTGTKNAIIKLNQDGQSGRKIAQMLGINPSTVHKFIKRYRTRHCVENNQRSGRPRKCTDRLDRQLIRIVKTDRRNFLKDLTNVLNERTPVKLVSQLLKGEHGGAQNFAAVSMITGKG